MSWGTSGWDLYNFDQYDTFLSPEDSDVAYATYRVWPVLPQIIPGFVWCRRNNSCRGELSKGRPINFSPCLPSYCLVMLCLSGCSLPFPDSRFVCAGEKTTDISSTEINWISGSKFFLKGISENAKGAPIRGLLYGSRVAPPARGSEPANW